MPRAVPGPTQLPAPCRSDLLTVDGRAGARAHHRHHARRPPRSGRSRCSGCGSAARRDHPRARAALVQTQPGFPPGVDVDIDSLVLDSAPGGAALPATPSGRVAPAQSGPAPSVTVTHRTRRRPPSSSTTPRARSGWSWARAPTPDGTPPRPRARTSAPPQVIDGYANGWLVTPSTPGHDMVINLHWTPQRLVWVALAVSAATLVACTVVACWRPRRRRRAAPATPASATTAPPPRCDGIDETARLDTLGPFDAAPTLGAPWSSAGDRPRWATVLSVSVVAGAVTSAIVAPLAGLPVAVAAFVALVARPGRALLALAAVGILVAVDWTVTNGQATARYAGGVRLAEPFRERRQAGVAGGRRPRGRRAGARGAPEAPATLGLRRQAPDPFTTADVSGPGCGGGGGCRRGRRGRGRRQPDVLPASAPQALPTVMMRRHGAGPRPTVDVSPLPAPEAVDDTSDVDGGRRRHRRRFGRRRPRHGLDAARPRHFPCFDGLRALAALLVVAVHTSFASGFSGRSWVGIYTSRLEVGVAVFFLISGFLLYRPFAASHIAGRAAPAVGRFWVRRFLRIVPAYWLAFLVTDYVMHIDTKVHPGWHSLLIYLGLVQLYFPSHALTGLTQAWSLCTEVVLLPLRAAVRRARGARAAGPTASNCAASCRRWRGSSSSGSALRFWLLHLHSHLAYVMLEWLPACSGPVRPRACSWPCSAAGSPTEARRRAGCGTRPCPGSAGRWPLGSLWAVSHLGVSRVPARAQPARAGTRPRGAVRPVRVLRAPSRPSSARSGAAPSAGRCGANPWPPWGSISYGIYLWHQAWVDLYIRWTGDLFRIPLPHPLRCGPGPVGG